VEALFSIDGQRGGEIAKRFKEAEGEPKQFFDAVNFPKPLTVTEFAKKVDAKVLYGRDKIESIQLFGATIIDAVKVILELPYESFVKVYGTTSQRALVFTGVATGRSTLVAVRLAPIKPACVLLHGVNPEEVDKLAVRIAESEGIPLLATTVPIEELRKRVSTNG
jgi:putative transcriptional regulator